jgi:hypothetical protein
VAADSYWRGWTSVEVRFVKADLPRVPAHWVRFQQRSSPIANGPRLAVDPPNCIVNYLAGVLEAATRVDCLAIGMDESLAIIHADVPARSSMIFDLCEPARPDIERFAIQLLESHTFSRRDFAELPSGACRVMPPTRDVLAATGPTWRESVAPHVEEAARIIAVHAGIPEPPTLVANSRRRAARNTISRANPTPRLHPPRVCTDCGASVSGNRKRCLDCRTAQNEVRLTEHAKVEAARRTETNDHPSHRADVRASIAATQRRHAQTREAVPTGFSGHPSEFERLIRRRLQGVSISYLARETGLSATYLRDVQAGRRVPSVRWWPALQLAALRAGEASADASGLSGPDRVYGHGPPRP